MTGLAAAAASPDRDDAPEEKPKPFVEYFDPPNRVAEKVRRESGSIEEVLNRAERAVREMSDGFYLAFRTELDRIGALAAEAQADPALRPERLAAIWRIAHDLRAQGATYGYALVTEIATSLAQLLDGRRRTTFARPDFHLLDLHIAALRAVVREDVKGTGNALARDLVAGLNEALAHVMRPGR